VSDSHFEFEGPPSLHRLDPAVIGNLSDDVLESALVGYVVDRWTQYGGESQGLAAMPSALAAWYVTFIVDGEVLNGGFNQLFFNASAGASPSAADAFETVGLPKAADIMRRALTLLEDHPLPLTRLGRKERSKPSWKPTTRTLSKLWTGSMPRLRRSFATSVFGSSVSRRNRSDILEQLLDINFELQH
jgi:hypothetical protein